VHLIFRTFLVWLRRNGPRLDIRDVARLPLRVMPTDLDILGHVNNGVYLSIMDLGRMDLFLRSGVWATMRRAGIRPVMANETITFRKSLLNGQRFVLETRIVGFDERAMYTEQRVVVDGEIYSRATMRNRFIKVTGGTATIRELSDATGIDMSNDPPAEWIDRWSADVRLPSTGSPAPSVWGGSSDSPASL
jgi:acyl-CoA thioesterase FadM